MPSDGSKMGKPPMKNVQGMHVANWTVSGLIFAVAGILGICGWVALWGTACGLRSGAQPVAPSLVAGILSCSAL